MARRSRLPVFLATALLLLAEFSWAAGSPDAAATGSSPPHEAIYNSQVDTTVHVPTRYGDQLTIDLEFPAVDGKQAPGRFPVITCLCYIGNVDTVGINFTAGKSAFARAGYVAATVRVPGSGTSEGGPWDMSSTKWQQENYDAIEWLGTQSWSDGNVGTIGESGNGMSQVFTSQLRPPHLKTMIVEASGADSYDTLMPGGMLSMQILLFACGIPGALTSLMQGVPVSPVNSNNLTLTPAELKYLLQADTKKLLTANVTPFCPLIDGWYNHPTRDSFWTGGPLAKIQNVTIPVWAWSGWDDIFRRAIPNFYTNVGSSQKMLTMGLNSHESPGGGDGFDQTAEALQWFDHYLKGKDNGITQQLTDDGFRYYVNEGFDWKSAPSYPIPGTDYTPFYLNSGSRSLLTQGSLSTSAPTTPGQNGYLYTPVSLRNLTALTDNLTEVEDDLVNPFDPNNPKNDNGTDNNLTNGDQRLDTGPDTVTYISAPLARDVEVTGPVTATLYAKTTAKDTDFVFRLIDAFPSDQNGPRGTQRGFWKLATEGNLKGAFRTYKDDYAKATPIPTGKVVRYDVQGYPTSYLFKKGHRIAITISSSEAPMLLPNLNPAAVTIMHSAQYPSEITLPIIGPGADSHLYTAPSAP